MIINDDSHDYTCTDCLHTGRACMEAIWLCQQLTRKMADAGPESGREMTSSARFMGCGFGCDAAVRIRGDEVQIFCGIDAGGLDRAAGEVTPRLPRAMVLAAPAERTSEVEARRA